MSRVTRICLWTFAALATLLLGVALAQGPLDSQSPPTSAPAPQPAAATAGAPTTSLAPAPATAPATRSYGKDVVMLDELVAMYEPVPFAHRKHAEMADMWDGCTTCHHHTPDAATQPAATHPSPATPLAHPSKDAAAAVPACKSCHASTPATAEIRMPSLKGAYHRQCLNCHREWMDSNACTICHAARKTGSPASAPAPAPDDITGRMHKPIPEPKTHLYTARFAPVAGPNVLFRHDEHVKRFGLKCVVCHRRDNCVDCHAADAATREASTHPRPLKPGRTWRDAHGPCLACHQADRCNGCHYPDGKSPPPSFEHRITGQTMDVNHVTLACGQCHANLKTAAKPTCGNASCHKRPVALPVDRPGPYAAPVSTPASTTMPATLTTAPATSPATRPIITRIRRGGL